MGDFVLMVLFAVVLSNVFTCGHPWPFWPCSQKVKKEATRYTAAMLDKKKKK
jgi:hypothetical protein